MRFEKDVIEFGNIPEGEKAGLEIMFTNIGKRDLEIEVVSVCECMLVDWTLEAIPPGKTGKVNMIFDSAGRPGDVTKDIDVIFKNTDKNDYPLVKRVVFKAKVLPKK